MKSKYFLNAIAVLSVLITLIGGMSPLQAEDKPAKPSGGWDECVAALESMPDYWIGWRRDFHNGYADSFQFYNSAAEYESPAVLVTASTIDDVAYETNTSCFDAAGKLTFLSTVMRSANMVGDAGTQTERYGEVYFDADGKIIKTLGWIENGGLGADMKPVKFALDDPAYRLARDCQPVALYKTIGDVQKGLDAELGDIEGKRPAFTPEGYDWCAAAVAP